MTCFLMFMVFYFSNDYNEKKEDLMPGYMSEYKLIIIILAFFKVMFFMRVFERFGFMVQMILSCLTDLVPFIVYFITFLLMYSLCFTSLNVLTDDEVNGASNLSQFQRTFLQAFRTSIGELGMPTYKTTVVDNPKLSEYQKNVKIFLIWFVWFTQTFSMLVVMLNFIIAVITSTYERVNIDQKFISYQHKASLNQECYELLNIFGRSNEIQLILFLNEKEESFYKEDPTVTMMEDIKKLLTQEAKQVKAVHDQIKQTV
jgi:hypothetical protein